MYGPGVVNSGRPFVSHGEIAWVWKSSSSTLSMCRGSKCSDVHATLTRALQ